MSRQEKTAALLLFANDLAMLVVALAVAFAWRYGGRFPNEPASRPTDYTVLFGGLMLVATLLLFVGNRLYDPDALFSGHREYAATFKAITYGTGSILILAFLANQPISRGALVLAWFLAIPFVGGARFLVRRVIFRLRESGRFVRRCLVVGTGAHGVAVARQLNWPASAGVRVVGFLDDYRAVGSHVADGLRVLGDPRAVREVARRYGVSTVVVLPNAVSWESYRDLLELASSREGIRLKLAPGLQDLVTTGAEVTDSGFLPLVSVQPLRITGPDALMKRTLDYLGSVPLLLLLAPCVVLCWLASRIDGDGAFFAREPVLGRQQERFSLLMLAEPAGRLPPSLLPRFAWRFRRLVATSRLGKLPNIVNVIAGHMSLVGPRALVEQDGAVDEPWLRNLMRVRPGLTGPAADTSRREEAEQQALMDIGYVRDYSIWLDLRLLFASLKRVLGRQRSLPPSYRPLRIEEKERGRPAAPTIAERLP
jgi:lipopolysaccharide/colanic/teichoic acid biosynthesis glycosyltransferase